MGYNRSGDRRKARLRRTKKEQERLARKASPEAKSNGTPKKDEPGKSGN